MDVLAPMLSSVWSRGEIPGSKLNSGFKAGRTQIVSGADPAGGLRGSEPLPNDKGRSCAEGAEAPISILFRQ